MKNHKALKRAAIVVDALFLLFLLMPIYILIVFDYAIELFGFAFSAWAVMAFCVGVATLLFKYRASCLPSGIYERPTKQEIEDNEKIFKKIKENPEIMKGFYYDNMWYMVLYLLIGVFIALAVVGIFSDGTAKRLDIAQKELSRLQEKQCVLNEPHELKFSKYRVKPVYVKADRGVFTEIDRVQYVTAKISVTMYERKKEKHKMPNRTVKYDCRNGEKVESKFRFRKLMTNVKI